MTGSGNGPAIDELPKGGVYGVRKRTIAAAALTAVLLCICALACAEGQTNPRRKHVEETIRWRQRREGLFLDSGVTVAVTCGRAPTLSAPGKFSVTVENDDGSRWLYEYGVSDNERDAGGYIYFGNATESSTFEDFAFYSAGEYTLHVFLYRAESPETRVARTSYRFTVEEEAGYPTLEEKAQSIVDECRAAGDDWQTALNLHDWLTGHTYYDQTYEYYGADVLFRGKGVCDAYSKAFKLLCETAGITAERVSSFAQNHAWNVMELDGMWYQVDVTWDDPSGGTAAVSGNEDHCYYCLSDDVLYLDHTRYDASYDPGCHSMEMNYYIRKNEWEQFGIYNYSGATVAGDLLNLLEQGNTNPEFSLDDWTYYWPSETGRGMSAARYGIYAAGMKSSDWTLENGGKLNVEIVLDYDDRYISLSVLGWDIAETGTLTMPAGILMIDENAFEGVRATTAVIPEGCTQINAGAFLNSGIRTVYVPESLTVIQGDPFEGCGRIIFFVSGFNPGIADYAETYNQMVINQ